MNEVGGRIHDSSDFEIVNGSRLQRDGDDLPNRVLVHDITEGSISISKHLFRQGEDARERVPIDIRFGRIDEGSDNP